MRYTLDDCTDYDVVIVGNGMAAIAAGAVLVNEGKRVALVDAHTELGGRFGSTNYKGYWLPWGHRDGQGFADWVLLPNAVKVAAKRAGVNLKLRKFTQYFAKLHLINDNPRTIEVDNWVWPIRSVPDAARIAEKILRICVPGISEETLPRLSEEFVSISTDIASLGMEEAYRLIPVTLAEYLDGKEINLEVRHALYQLLETQASTPPQEQSVGRLAYRFIMSPEEGAAAHLPADDEVGGMQALIEMFRRRFVECGGELWLDWKPIEITTDNNVDSPEVSGVIAVNQSNLVHRFRAPVVITDFDGWRIPELIDERLLPPLFMRYAREAEAAAKRVDLVQWSAGLHRLPRRRSDGKVEDTFFHRFVGGRSSDFGYVGGLVVKSQFDPRTAPPGKHLMYLWDQRAESPSPFRTWSDAQKLMDRLLAYVFDYYGDLEDCLDWARYTYQQAPVGVIWRMVYAGHLHPVGVSTVEGLYAISFTAETPAIPQDAEFALALKGIELATLERGHLWGTTGSSTMAPPISN